MKSIYTSLEDAKVSLAKLTAEERRFLGALSQQAAGGVSYLDFENLYADPSSPVFVHAKRLGRPVRETPLFQVCADMAKRLGIQQGYLVREEVIAQGQDASRGETRELTTGDVAKIAACTGEAVRKAIRSGRLRARRVGRLSLVSEADALAFVRVREDARHYAGVR